MSRLCLGLDLAKVTPSKVVAAHPERPFLFIQCTDDTTVPLHHGLDLKAASTNPRTELWVVPGCEHVMAYATHPDEWAQRVLAFLGRELGGEKPVLVPAGILAAPRRGGRRDHERTTRSLGGFAAREPHGRRAAEVSPWREGHAGPDLAQEGHDRSEARAHCRAAVVHRGGRAPASPWRRPFGDP